MNHYGLQKGQHSPLRRRPLIQAAAMVTLVAAGVIGVTGTVYASGHNDSVQIMSTPVGSPAPTLASAIEPTVSTTVQPATTTQPEPAAKPDTTVQQVTTTQPVTTAPGGQEPDTLQVGDSGTAVEQLQARLVELGFRIGTAADGDYGSGTASAVMAFQKFEGIGRDGIAGPEVLSQLDTPTGTATDWTGESQIEVDLARQIVITWDGGGNRTILNASTGSGETYIGEGGVESRATTPTGDFVIERRIDGVRESYLGFLYRPLYFHEGWAIHGSDNVPAQPASHGCVRVRNADQDWLYTNFSDGTSITIP